MPNSENPPLLAARVGKYLMLEMLGQGAFGKVRLAVDETDGQQYAIKIMEKSHIKANELTLQVRREIAVMKAMRHPNIVNLHEVLTSSKNLYMVMDLVTGGELFDAVAEAGKLSESRARLYFQQLVDGVHYCHKRRVYHRDLKPENLLLSEDKQTIKITDFGLSSIKASNAPDELLHTIMGSPHYIAPEIITSAAAGYDGAKVDVWASGVILYGMLAGYLPFDEPVMNLLYRSIVKKQVSFPAHFSYDAVKLLKAMLLKDPSKRPTMDDVRQFNWFRVNYQPAVPDDVVDSAVPVQAPKKGKMKARVKKATATRARKKQQNGDANDVNQPQLQPQPQPQSKAPGSASEPTSPSGATPKADDRDRDRNRDRNPDRNPDRPPSDLHDQYAQSYRISQHHRNVPTPNKARYESGSASMAVGDGRRQAQSVASSCGELESSPRDRVLSNNQALAESSKAAPGQRIQQNQYQRHNQVHQHTQQRSSSSLSTEDTGRQPRDNSDVSRSVGVSSTSRTSGAIMHSASGSNKSNNESEQKRPPMLTNMMPASYASEQQNQHQTDGDVQQSAVAVKGSSSFNVNVNDVNNACEQVETPMPVGQLNEEMELKRRPFSSATTTTAASLKQRRASNNFGFHNPTRALTSRASLTARKSFLHEYNRCGSVDKNSANAGSSGTSRTTSTTATTTGPTISSITSLHSRRELSGGSSGGFRDGVKKVLENGLEALSTRYSRSKAHIEMAPKLSLHNLFSSNHPAEIPIHPRQPMPDKDGKVDEDTNDKTVYGNVPNNRYDNPSVVVDIHREQRLSEPAAQARTRERQSLPPRPMHNPHDAAIDDPNSEPALSYHTAEQSNPPARNNDATATPAIPPLAATIGAQCVDETELSKTAFGNKGALPPMSPAITQESDSSTLTPKDENPFTMIADDEEKENVVIDNTILSYCSPVSSTNASSLTKQGIFKPVRSVFKPLVKQLLMDDDEQSNLKNACGEGGNEHTYMEDNGGVSSEWGADQGDDLFADYEAEDESMKLPLHSGSGSGKPQFGPSKFINDLRHAQSMSNTLPSTSSSSSTSGFPQDSSAKSQYGNAESKAIFGSINHELALKLTMSSANDDSSSSQGK